MAAMGILMICAGLLLGLALGGSHLPASGPVRSIPLGFDVLAAGVAVAAYGTFFNMRWRILPIPVLVGMLAHVSRWTAITEFGAGAETGAFIACLLVGVTMSLVSDHLRLPFAGLAFASVVSLIPGLFLFRMAGGLVGLLSLGPQAPPGLFSQVMADGTSAVLIMLAMVFGLVVPRIWMEDVKTFLTRHSQKAGAMDRIG